MLTASIPLPSSLSILLHRRLSDVHQTVQRESSFTALYLSTYVLLLIALRLILANFYVQFVVWHILHRRISIGRIHQVNFVAILK
jgi:hypothetical protein